MPYPYMSVEEMRSHIPEARKEAVSEIARGHWQFVERYTRAGIPSNLPPEWDSKRYNFIKRHLALYRKNPTYRRKLALYMWAYDPEK